MAARDPQYRQVLEQGFKHAAFVHENGIRLLDLGPGWCEAEVELKPHHLQHTGVPHGGLIATLADHCAGAAAMTLAAPGEQALTAEFKVSFLRGLRSARLQCRAEVVKPGSQLTFVEATVDAIDGSERRMVARASVTLAVIAPRAS